MPPSFVGNGEYKQLLSYSPLPRVTKAMKKSQRVSSLQRIDQAGGQISVKQQSNRRGYSIGERKLEVVQARTMPDWIAECITTPA